MNLGLLLSPGDSLTKQKKSGQLDRLIKYYLTPYSKHFKKIYLFSYSNKKRNFNLPANISIVIKPKFIPYLLYQFLIPFIHRKKFNQIHVFRVFQAIGGTPLLLIKKPSLVTYGYHYHKFAAIEKKLIRAKIISLLIKPILKKATKIIVTSTENQAYLSKLGLNSKVVFIPNGVDPDIFKPNLKRPSSYSVLSIGRLVRQKNHQFLIKAISQSKYRSKIKLTIIGQGPLKKSLLKLSKSLQVNLTINNNLPYQKLVSCYRQAAVFCLTSAIEGNPKVLLESMSSGCACLTVYFEGNLINHQQTGLIASNQKDFTSKLDYLITNPKSRLSIASKARNQIKKDYHLQKLIQKEIALISSILKT